MQLHDQLDAMNAQQLREFAAGLIETLVIKDRELIPRRRYPAHRQQLGRESDPTDRVGSLELAVRRIATGGKACRGGHEPDSIRAAEWARPLSIPQGRARTVADTTCEPHWRIAAACLGSDVDVLIPGCEAWTGAMDDLLEEMWQCKSVQACIDLALTDAYGED
jgi:hypothetical protein